MNIEIQSAVIGAVVGAVVAGIVSYILLLSAEKGNYLKAFEVFEFFHKKVSQVGLQSLKVQQRDFPALLSSYSEISDFIIKNGDSVTVKIFVEYGVTLRELIIHVMASHQGLTGYPQQELDKFIKDAEKNLSQKGILARHLQI